jgi:CRISPR-associated protein Cmr1
LPIVGGGHQTRAIDDVEIIRAASVRGQLRFWWRALHASQYPSAKKLYERESALWGCDATDGRGRSEVESHIDVAREEGPDNSDIRLYYTREGPATPGAYALWPAPEEGRTNTPPNPRRP